ncbi:MAG: YdcF family protein [Pseudomonadota bacterium]
MDLLFFYVSKILWMIFSPDIILVMLLITGVTLLFLKSHKRAKIVLSITVFLIVTITLFPAGDWLLYPLETRFPVQKALPACVDGIIVLAGAEKIYSSVLWQQVEFNESAERMFAFLHLIKQYPTARHLFIGGTGSLNLQEYKSTQVARQLLEEQGIDPDQILFESESKNTYENAIFSFQKINPKPGEQWVLITSASHMARSVGCFNKAGWLVIPYPVDHNVHEKTLYRLTLDFSGNLKWLKYALSEWVGLGAYYLTGKTNQLFPGPYDQSKK